MIKTYILFFLMLTALHLTAQEPVLKKQIGAITTGKQATVAVSVLSLDDDFQLDINGKKRLPMQSVFKIHIALAVLDKVDGASLALENEVPLPQHLLQTDTWSPMMTELAATGQRALPLARLTEYAVAQSDNNATDVLLNLIGGTTAVQQFLTEHDIHDVSVKYNEAEMHAITDLQYENYTTTNSLNEILKKLYNGKLISPSSTEFLIKVMEKTNTGANRLISQLPKNTIVAHKTGTSSTERGVTAATNDAGVVTLPDGRRYAISVFVSDSREDEATNEKIIADISKTAFDYLRKN